ncbi:MAG: phosphopantetheine-binding protein [Coriobacteriales bacterium]|jgi:acyl carrier protein|nr:phosphopantetheine-binding protein [Coriobacteriales bacterium]MDO5709017.1 phosphopantetheine-binding protein [Coriobacteriales bacterium]
MDEITLEDIIEILQDVEEDVDYETETALVDNRVLDSFDILSIISALNDEFDISIPAKDVIPENFNSAAAMRDMVQRLIDED